MLLVAVYSSQVVGWLGSIADFVINMKISKRRMDQALLIPTRPSDGCGRLRPNPAQPSLIAPDLFSQALLESAAEHTRRISNPRYRRNINLFRCRFSWWTVRARNPMRFGWISR